MIVCLSFLGWLAAFSVAGAGETSRLWGLKGEKWFAESRLPDFSFAGYHRGESGLPLGKVTSNIRDFGAKGDGKTDDTAAFRRAFEEAPEGVILVPKGRYVITKPLVLKRSNVVLRGKDRDESVLYFPKPLNEVVPKWSSTTSGRKTSSYSWSGGFVGIRGSLSRKHLAKVKKAARRGARTLTLDSTGKLEVGQEIMIEQSDLDDNSLAAHLYSGDPGSLKKVRGRAVTSLVTRITGIEGKRIAFDRPLRTDLELRWSPEIKLFDPSVTESGIENLSFEFPVTPYKGHFTEKGYNALVFGNTAHCWIRRIKILNADSGIFVGGYFNTLQNVVVESERKEDKRRESTGHHGITLRNGSNLCTGVDFRTCFIHDFTLSYRSHGNVFSDSKGKDLSLDHHKLCPYENLFTNIDAGAGTRLWRCGGGSKLGKHCGARGTFWNITAERNLKYPPSNFGPWSMNLVGLKTKQKEKTEAEGKWFEVIDPEQLRPQNLHRSQLKRRARK